ncbi:hypothetical protein CLAVI_000499 [Candidatus Clavichlamydia salmonicola]|uniref:ankyrin repeat domain-containing protein n=1 Tax=Candidatus Clavichlamydia salmonicola TaxID=469812 RepID=UPI001891B070|nr:ankyrin repeat domain-containing protein [Candidatus Clavichlamydia salmonicola]MBF5050877.1 hypothetical protein [Candidatus Clavichlamydia salmonicola]
MLSTSSIKNTSKSFHSCLSSRNTQRYLMLSLIISVVMLGLFLISSVLLRGTLLGEILIGAVFFSLVSILIYSCLYTLSCKRRTKEEAILALEVEKFILSSGVNKKIIRKDKNNQVLLNATLSKLNTADEQVLKQLYNADKGQQFMAKFLPHILVKFEKTPAIPLVILSPEEQLHKFCLAVMKTTSLDVFKRDFQGLTSPDQENIHGLTPMWYAIGFGNISAIQFLLDNGANINWQHPSSRYSLLHYAVEKGDNQIIKELISRGADHSIRDALKRNILHQAIDLHDIEISKLLIRLGISIVAQDIRWVTPFVQIFLQRKDVNLAKECWNEMTADQKVMAVSFVHDSGETLLHLASKNGWIDFIIWFIDMGINVNAQTQLGVTPLMAAAAENQIKSVTTLLQYNANQSVWDSLFRSAYDLCSPKSSLKKILSPQKGERMEKIADNELHMSLLLGKADEYVKNLLILSPALLGQRNDYGRTPLFYAAIYGDQDLINLLLNQGANIFLRDQVGMTAAFYALVESKVENYQLLINHQNHYGKDAVDGMLSELFIENEDLLQLREYQKLVPLIRSKKTDDLLAIIYQDLLFSDVVDLLDVHLHTQLFYAIMDQDLEKCKLLVHAGAEVLIAQGPRQESVYHYIVKKNHLTILDFICSPAMQQILNIPNKTFLNISSAYGESLMHIAAQCGHLEMLRKLYRLGFSVQDIDYLGDTPLVHAKRFGHNEIEEQINIWTVNVGYYTCHTGLSNN